MSFKRSDAITIKMLLVSFALFATAACEGPAGIDGQDGQDGSANVTLYIFPEHDFNVKPKWIYCFQSLTREEWVQSEWSAFLLHVQPISEIELQLTSTARHDDYYFTTFWNVNYPGDPLHCPDKAVTTIGFVGTRGAEVEEIHVLRVEAGSVEDCFSSRCRQVSSNLVIPGDLDMTDYAAVVEYFGITEENIVRM